MHIAFVTLTLLSSTLFFFFNDTATTEIYTLSLHDALPISRPFSTRGGRSSTSWASSRAPRCSSCTARCCGDRKSTRLNSSHGYISYAVFCLKKKKKKSIMIHNFTTWCLHKPVVRRQFAERK